MLLAVAAAIWIGVHVGLAGTGLRGLLVARMGEKGFMGLFSALSVLSIAALVIAYNAAPYVPLWTAPRALRWALVVVMWVAFALFVASVSGPNPTAVGASERVSGPVRGVFRITRHPMLWAFTLWALVHIAANGTLAAVLFFGAFAVTSLVGMPSIDAKLAARNPAKWAPLAAGTSIVPGAAILAGRNQLKLAEIGSLVPLLATIVWLVVLILHPYVIGVPALPY